MILDTKVIKPLIVNWSIKFVQSYSSSFQEGFHLCSFLHSPLGTYFRKTTKNFFNKCQILPWSDDWFQWKNSFTILGKRERIRVVWSHSAPSLGHVLDQQSAGPEAPGASSAQPRHMSVTRSPLQKHQPSCTTK